MAEREAGVRKSAFAEFENEVQGFGGSAPAAPLFPRPAPPCIGTWLGQTQLP